MAAAALAPELLVQLDPGRFRADNLLGAEDWDNALFGCLDDRLDSAPLFPSLDPDPMFGCAFDGGGGANPPDPPWLQEPRPVLQVKSEPGASPSCCASEPQIRRPSPPGAGPKPEPLPPPELAGPPRGLKAEGRPQSRGTPLIQPKPPLGGPQSPPKTLLLQPLPGGLHAPALLLSGSELLLCLPRPLPAPPKPDPAPGNGLGLSSGNGHAPGNGLGCSSGNGHAPGNGLGHTSGNGHAPGNAMGRASVNGHAPGNAMGRASGNGHASGNALGHAPGNGHAPPGASQLDVRALRRQQRMIKNRESASASRRRRKEYVRGLEQKLHLALQDNERLRRDNGHLRRRLLELQGQSAPPPPAPGPRGLLCLGLLLLLGMKLGGVSPPQPRPSPPAPPPPPLGRHLLALPPPGPKWGPGLETQRGLRNSSLTPTPPWDPPEPPPENPPGTPPGTPPECQRLNRSESLRLTHELRGWVRRHQSDLGTPGEPPRARQGQFQGSGFRLLPVEPRPERLAPVQLQLPPRIPASIERRDDTFYLVSFRRDHLLLPARSHNKTSRPKMSLVLPAASLNESAMMQVDCEVIDTRLIHVRRPRAPPPKNNPRGAATPPQNNPWAEATPPKNNPRGEATPTKNNSQG